MKYLYLSFLVALGMSSATANDDCCKFTIQYLNQVQEPPSEEKLAACVLNTDCDKRYFFAGKIINAYQRTDLDVMHEYFKEALVILKTYPKEDELSLHLVYLYATYLEMIGEMIVAGTYYSYVKAHSKDDTALRFLAKTGYFGIYAGGEATESTIKGIINKANSIPNITADQRMSIIIKTSNLAPIEFATSVHPKYYHLNESSKSKKLKNYFLAFAEFNISSLSHSSARGDLDEIKKANKESSLTEKNEMWNNVLSLRALNSGDYAAYLNFSRLALEEVIGPFKSLEQLLEILDKLEITPSDVVFRYAKSNLYQTRLGKGTEPVIYAFNIYDVRLGNYLKIKLQSVNSIVSERRQSTISEKHTPLIVGTYLYQKTRDLSYLSRSISLLDGFSSGGSQYWTLAREKMRTDKRFAAAIEKERALAEGMKYLAPEATLADIHQQQLAFEGHRDRMSEDFSAFYEELTAGYKIDLEEVQGDLATDSTGLVSFYQNNSILYRLFIASDTIDIAVMNDSRSEVLALTEELAETIPAGKSAEQTKKASRRLYQLLFAGIDSLLPERLHLVTNGKLEAIPFTALRRDNAAGPPRYFGVECAISRQSSIREMQMLEDLDLDPKFAQPLGMAPAFSNELLQASDLRQAGFKLPPLVFNTEEVRDLESRSAGQYYYDASATINRYVEDATDYGIIHLATHAISSQTDGLRSHLYLLDDDGQPAQLYASDIGDQTLNAELVVLSACETGGGGRHATEGRVGLTKAYLAAGARSVVSSNWAVDDHATAELMGSFYEQLEMGRAPHEALQHSRKTYLERHPDAAPYKWAAFEAHGGMKPVSWKQNHSIWPSLGYAAAVAFLAVIFGSYFRRRETSE